MSSIGIRSVLPYSGANGIVVNGSTISINPDSIIELGTGQINLRSSSGTNNRNTRISAGRVGVFLTDNGSNVDIQENVLIDDGLSIKKKDLLSNVILEISLNSTNKELVINDLVNDIYSIIGIDDIIVQNNLTDKKLELTSQLIQIVDNATGNNITITSDEIIVMDGNTGLNSQLLYNFLQFDSVGLYDNGGGLQLPSAALINIEDIQVGAVTPSITKYLLININGSLYKLIIAN